MTDFRIAVVSFTMVQSQAVSDVVHFAGGSQISLFAPTLNGVTSLGFLVGGDIMDVASGTLQPLYTSAGALVALPVPATGAFGMNITDLVGGFGAMQLVTPAAQTTARNFKLLVRL